MNYPEYAKVEDTTYKINTDFRVAIECNRIANDETINDYERVLGIICTLFGADALDNTNHYEKLLEIAKKYLSCGKQIEESYNDKDIDMDYIEDYDYIEASFMSDYHIDLSNTKMHWWKFNKLMNGLSNSEMGNCCILNRIRNLRKYDTSKIEDVKERKKIEDAKRMVALKKNRKENHLTKEQEESMNRLDDLIFRKE